jgi:hypothetical protein
MSSMRSPRLKHCSSNRQRWPAAVARVKRVGFHGRPFYARLQCASFINAGKPTGADLPGCRRERDFCRRSRRHRGAAPVNIETRSRPDLEPAIRGSPSHLKLSRSALHTPFLRGSALCLCSVPPSPGLPPGTGFLRPETGAPNVPKTRPMRRDTRAALTDREKPAENGPFRRQVFHGEFRLRTRARTWRAAISSSRSASGCC